MTTEYWIYILHCENDCYYTGYTTNLTRRYQQHLDGTASKYTRSFKPLKIAQSWRVNDKSLAMKIESYIKKLSREEKQHFLLHPDKLLQLFSG